MGEDKLLLAEKELEFICVEFYDPTYASGWVSRKDFPTLQESIQVGCGIVIEEDDKKLIIGMCVNKDNIPTDDVFTLFLINKSSIIKRTRLFPCRTVKARKKKTRKG